MKAICLREVERKVVGQDAMPQLGLGPRYGIMGLGELLNVVRASNHRVLEDLHRSDLRAMCKMTWASFGSFLSQLLCRASRVRAKATEETSFRSNPARPR